MAIFFVVLFILQVRMFIRIRNKSSTQERRILLAVIVYSILLSGIFGVYSLSSMMLVGWNFILYLIISFVSILVYVLLFGFCIITWKKQVLDSKESNGSLRKGIMMIVSISVAFLIALLIEYLPYRIEQRNDRLKAKDAKEEIIVLLEQRYGDGDFEIVNMSEKNICYGCSWLGPGVDGYEFEMDTSYLDKSFVVSLRKDDFTIYDNEFLNMYYAEKFGITHLEEYLKEYKVQKLNEMISSDFNVEIDFNNIFVSEYLNKEYGYIPSIDELSVFVELHDPKFEIHEELYSEEELLEYLVGLTRYFISELDTSNIIYSQTSKYFRYKYDYTKLGVSDHTDQYSGYGGYVLAGNYIYSEELGHYVVENENSIVNISVMGNVVSFDIEDILKGSVE